MTLPVRTAIPKNREGATLRSIILGVLGTALLAVVTPVSDLYIQGTWLAACHLPIGVVCVLFILLMAVNPLLARIGKPLRHTEIIIIYCMMLVSAGIPSLGLSAYLIPVLASPLYYQTPENEWVRTFFQYIPDWLTPNDANASNFFYEGLPAGAPVPWLVWIKPLALWSIFTLGLFLTMTCLCVILRKQWIQRERLVFPLVQLPMDMFASSISSTGFHSVGNGVRRLQLGERDISGKIPAFFRNPFMWVGFAIPLFIHGWNGLHFHIPAVPQIRLFYDLGVYFTEKPFNVVRPLWAIIHFSAIGFVYLLPTDLAFSLWFFYILFHVHAVLGVMFGMPLGQSTGYTTRGFAAYQMAGAILMLVLTALWRGRHHLGTIMRSVVSKTSDTDMSDEPMSYRAAVGGLLLGIVVMCFWSVAAGVNLGVIVLVVVLFLMTMIAMTRMVSEGGLLFIQTPFRPVDLISPVSGTAPFGAASLTVLAFEEMIFMFDIRSSMMPSVMDSFKLLDSSAVKRRHLLGPVGLSIIVAMVVSYVSVLTICYRYGGNNLSRWFCIGAPQLPFRRLTAMLVNPQEPDMYSVTFMLIGGAVMLIFTLMRQRFLWWPFHPIGYAMGPSWPMIQLWFSILIGFLCKWTVLKSGGVRLFRRWRPFFLGMVLGEFLSGGLWLLIDFLLGKQGHRIFLF